MIKILSLYYRNFNYGGQLQAWALCHVLKRLGKDCVQISFDSGSTCKRSLWSRFSGITVEKFLNKLNQLCNLNFKKKLIIRKTKFLEFEKKIPHTAVYDRKTISKCVRPDDIFIVGSDQVWNPDWTSNIYFLDFVPTSNLKIAYAASFGKSEISTDFMKQVSKYLEDFAFISVREKEAEKVLKNSLSKKVHLVLDPTLLVNEVEWGKLAVSPQVKEPYLFVYLLGTNANHKKLIKEYATRKHLKIVYIPHVHFSYQISDYSFADEELYNVGPEEFLGLVQNANEVITDSFHGCVFSIVFKKQFCAFKRHRDNASVNMNSRLYTLFDFLNLKTRLVGDDFSIEDVEKLMSSSIDYENVEKSLEKLREQSLNYLIKAISKTR